MKKIILISMAAIAAIISIKVKQRMGATKERESPETILYNYTIALHQESGVELPDHKLYTLEQKQLFAKLLMLGKCPKCNRFFLRKIAQCPDCQKSLEPIPTEEFLTFALACEEFHSGLREASHIKTLNYSQIMKLYRLKETSQYVR